MFVSSQGDVILQSDHVIETLTKIMICADKINSININQGRWAEHKHKDQLCVTLLQWWT